jgi:hypothetical protein
VGWASLEGRILETDAPDTRKYLSIVETKGGKVCLYRKYWTPMISRDADGGRDAWTAAFGSPEQEEVA